MASYKHFQSDNMKYDSNESRTNMYNPNFQSTVLSKGYKENANFLKHLDKWVQFVSWARWNPDLFYDLITPETGGIVIDIDERIFLRSTARFLSCYGVFPRGYGKCQNMETLIYTSTGIKEMGEFFNYQKDNKETYIPCDIELLNRDGELETSNIGVYSGYLPTKIITTEEGYEVENTFNHPMLVMSDNGIIDWKVSEDIKIGDYVLINRNNDIWGTNVKLDIDYDKLNNVKHINTCNIIDTLDEDFALIMGYLIGDGCLTSERTITLTNIDEDIINNYTNFMNNNLNINVVHRRIDYIIFGKYIREYFRQIGFDLCNAHNKTVPKCIMESPKSIVSNFIKGLFDTDGGLSNSYIEYCTASKKLSKQVQVILLNFGIISTRTKKYNKKFNSYSYRLCIYGHNMDIYLKEIGFSCKRKQNQLIKLCEVERNPNKDIIPNQQNQINLFYNDIKKYNTYVYDNIYHLLKGTNELTYKKLDYLLSLKNAELCNNFKELKYKYNTNYFYSKVKTIEDSNNHVCDLQTNETHSFVSNGFISHNTLLEVMSMYHGAIFYPDINNAMSAQTKENAAKLLSEKHREILKFYPLMANEIRSSKFSKDTAEVTFTSGGRVDILANQQNTKGARRHTLNIEESALLNNLLFEDVLEPVVNVPRRTIGKLALINSDELNGKINYFTTSGFKGSSEHERNIIMIKEMANLEGKMVFGSDWNLAVGFGRGETKAQILAKKEKLSPIFFAMNYGSKWTGATDNALVDINKLLTLRTLTKEEFKSDDKSEYILGVDVARSESKANNQSSIAVLKIKRNQNNKITFIKLVNMINVSNMLTFQAQAMEVKKVKLLYNAKVVIIDSNGLGKGLLDDLVLETFDINTGDSLGCWATINNPDIKPEIDNSEKIIYDLKPQSAQSEIIIAFIDMVTSGKLQLLEKRANAGYDIDDKDYATKMLPYINTDLLMEEISNLKIKQLSSGKYSIEKTISRIDKDRFSALAYGLWYIKTFEDNIYQETEIDAMKYLFIN